MKYIVASPDGWNGYASGATVTDPAVDEGSLAVLVKVGVLVPQATPTPKNEE